MQRKMVKLSLHKLKKNRKEKRRNNENGRYGNFKADRGYYQGVPYLGDDLNYYCYCGWDNCRNCKSMLRRRVWLFFL